MRELRLEREFEEGDWLFLDNWPGPEWPREPCVWASPQRIVRTGDQHGAIWLPRLDQWLAMLETTIELEPEAMFVGRQGSFRLVSRWTESNSAAGADAPTREEACARLWRQLVASREY